MSWQVANHESPKWDKRPFNYAKLTAVENLSGQFSRRIVAPMARIDLSARFACFQFNSDPNGALEGDVYLIDNMIVT